MNKIENLKQDGFSLIELLIALSIVGIVATIAFPSYQSMMASGARSTVQADLMSFASAMERHSTANYSYKGAAESGGDTGSPEIFVGYSPASEPESNKKYTLTIDSVSDDGSQYELKATPVTNSMVDGTGEIYYFSDGRKAWDQNNDGNLQSDEYCWHC